MIEKEKPLQGIDFVGASYSPTAKKKKVFTLPTPRSIEEEEKQSIFLSYLEVGKRIGFKEERAILSANNGVKNATGEGILTEEEIIESI